MPGGNKRVLSMGSALVVAAVLVRPLFSADHLVAAQQHDTSPHHFLRTEDDVIDTNGQQLLQQQTHHHLTRRRASGEDGGGSSGAPPGNIGDATLAVTCRGSECQTTTTTGGTGSTANEPGGVATAADFFGGANAGIQNNLVGVMTNAGGDDGGTGMTTTQTAGEVSSTLFGDPESVADLIDQLDARKKARDEDRLCNTEDEQVSYLTTCRSVKSLFFF